MCMKVSEYIEDEALIRSQEYEIGWFKATNPSAVAISLQTSFVIPKAGFTGFSNLSFYEFLFY